MESGKSRFHTGIKRKISIYIYMGKTGNFGISEK